MPYLLWLLTTLLITEAAGNPLWVDPIEQALVESYLCVDREQAAALRAQGHPDELVTDGEVHCFLKPGVFSGLQAKAEAEGVKEPGTDGKLKPLSYLLAAVKFLQWCFGRDSSTMGRSAPKTFGKNTLLRNDLSPAGSLLTKNRFKRLSLINGLAMGGDSNFFLNAGGLSPGFPVSSQAAEELVLPGAEIPPELAALYQSLLQRLANLLKITQPDADRDLRSFCELLITVLSQASHPKFLPPDQLHPFFKLLDNLLTRLETLQQQVNSAHGDLRQVRRNLVMIQLGNATGPLMALVVLPEGDEETLARVVDELSRQEQEVAGATEDYARLGFIPKDGNISATDYLNGTLAVLRLKLKNGWGNALVLRRQINRIQSQMAEIPPSPPAADIDTAHSIPGVIHLSNGKGKSSSSSQAAASRDSSSQDGGETPSEIRKKTGDTEQGNGGGGTPPDQRPCSKCQKKPPEGSSGLCRDCQASLMSLPNETLERIFSYLPHKDLVALKQVNSHCSALFEGNCLEAVGFCRSRHTMGRLHYSGNFLWHDKSGLRTWFRCFNDSGEQTAEWLDKQAGHASFPELLFFSVARTLARAKYLQGICYGRFFKVHIACFSPDINQVVTASCDPGGPRPAYSIKFHEPEKKTDMHCLTTGTVYYSDYWDWVEKSSISCDSWVAGVGFSPNRRYILTGTRDSANTVSIYKAVDEKQWVKLTDIRHNKKVQIAKFSPGGRYVVTASVDNFAKIIDFDGRERRETIVPHTMQARIPGFSSDETHIVTVHDIDTVKVYGLADGTWQDEASIQHPHVISASFTPQNYIAVTSNTDCSIYEFVDKKWQKKSTVNYNLRVESASFSLDGSHILIVPVADSSTIIYIYELVAGQFQRKTSIGHDYFIRNARFSPDGNHVVIAARHRHVLIAGLVDRQWRMKGVLQSSSEALVRKACFSPDGGRVLVTYDNGEACIYSLAETTEEQVRDFFISQDGDQ